MDILNNIGSIFNFIKNPSDIIIWVIGGIIGLPLLSHVFDKFTQIISDFMVSINKNIIDKIPIEPLKEWLQNQQIQMLNKSIVKYQDTIQEIKKR